MPWPCYVNHRPCRLHSGYVQPRLVHAGIDNYLSYKLYKKTSANYLPASQRREKEPAHRTLPEPIQLQLLQPQWSTAIPAAAFRQLRMNLQQHLYQINLNLHHLNCSKRKDQIGSSVTSAGRPRTATIQIWLDTGTSLTTERKRQLTNLIQFSLIRMRPTHFQRYGPLLLLAPQKRLRSFVHSSRPNLRLRKLNNNRCFLHESAVYEIQLNQMTPIGPRHLQPLQDPECDPNTQHFHHSIELETFLSHSLSTESNSAKRS